MFDFWEQQRRPEDRLRWDQLHQRHQNNWRSICRVILEMGITVVMADAIQFIDHANGDMGGAFAKALRRYISERLE